MTTSSFSVWDRRADGSTAQSRSLSMWLVQEIRQLVLLYLRRAEHPSGKTGKAVGLMAGQ